ncbi:MAG TPA: hypothetical protein VGJ09_04600 [Bryobacteraceae bacterium]|jgi:hypothetical protein
MTMHIHRSILAIAVLAPLLHGDATLRYHTDVKTATGIPGLPSGASLADMSSMRDMVVRVKGNKAYSEQGHLTSILDLTTQEMTLIDAPHKLFAKVPAGKYAELAKSAIPVVPEEARVALASMKTSVDSRNTGRTAAIQGVQSEEHEFVLSIEMPAGGPPLAGPMMKMLVQIWTAKAEEAQRIPALQEVQNYTASASGAVNPVELIAQVFSAVPGLGDSLTSMIADMTKSGSVSMRVHTEVTMPFLAVMAQPGVPLPPGLDPGAPLMQMNQELVELSTDPLDDALFQVPQDYLPASLEEILKGVAAAPAPVAQQ